MRRLAILLPLLVACSKKKEGAQPDPQPPVRESESSEASWRRGENEPDRIEVTFLLVSFKGRTPKATRTQDRARQDAADLLDRARKGEDFEEMVKRECEPEFRNSGAFGIANYEVKSEGNEASRLGLAMRMGSAFGDLAFRLKVGEIGMVEYESRRNPLGWFILKRLK